MNNTEQLLEGFEQLQRDPSAYACVQTLPNRSFLSIATFLTQKLVLWLMTAEFRLPVFVPTQQTLGQWETWLSDDRRLAGIQRLIKFFIDRSLYNAVLEMPECIAHSYVAYNITQQFVAAQSQARANFHVRNQDAAIPPYITPTPAQKQPWQAPLWPLSKAEARKQREEPPARKRCMMADFASSMRTAQAAPSWSSRLAIRKIFPA